MQPQQTSIGDPNCNLCHGVGYLRDDVPMTDPKFGEISPCDCRAEEIKAVNDIKNEHSRSDMLSASGLRNLNLLLSDIKDRGEGSRAMLRVGQEILDGKRYTVTVWGDPGNGKSLFIRAVASQWLRDGKDAIYSRANDLLNYLRMGYDAKDFETRYARLCNVKLLAIDEPEKIKVTEWVAENFFAIIDARYEKSKRREAVTLYASNKDPKYLEQFIYSRLRYGEHDPQGVSRIIHNTDSDAREAGL